MNSLEDVCFKCVIPSKRIGMMLYVGCGGKSGLFEDTDNTFFEFNGKDGKRIATHSRRMQFCQSLAPLLTAEDAIKWLSRVIE